jgi:hypothetical protein
VDLTVDAFHALARSSPWRWRSLHFRHRDDRSPDGVEAWIVRPGWIRVQEPGWRSPRIRQDKVDDGGLVVAYASDDPDVVPPPPPSPRWARDVTPVWRPDGLVAERPWDPYVRYDDPIHGDYTWVAMLDPEELSHHVALTDLEVSQRRGRETWWATVRALEGYEARCPGCCDLLWGGAEAGREHLVGLDVQTGVLVSLSLVEPTHRRWFIENEILAVDDDVLPPG